MTALFTAVARLSAQSAENAALVDRGHCSHRLQSLKWHITAPAHSSLRSRMLRGLRDGLRAQRQGQHTIDRLEENSPRTKRKCSTFFTESTKKCTRQLDEHCQCFKGISRKTLGRHGGAPVGFPELVNNHETVMLQTWLFYGYLRLTMGQLSVDTECDEVAKAVT